MYHCVNQHTTLSTVLGNTNKLELLNIITYFAVQKESKLIFSLFTNSVYLVALMYLLPYNWLKHNSI